MAVETPDKQSAEVEAMMPAWDLIGTLLGGTFAMRAAGQKYLPKMKAESDDAYKYRLSVSTLYGAFKRTVGTLSGKPFSEPLAYGDDIPPQIRKHCDDIDLEGRNLHSFAHAVFENAIGLGLSHILVDYPPTGGATKTVAQQRAIGARPYFVHVDPRNVLGWRAQRINGVRTLTQLRMLERVEEPAGAWGVQCIEQVRVLEPNAFQVYRKNEKSEWYLHEEGAVTIGCIPLATIYTGRTGFMTARPPLIDLAHLNVEHWQSASDQRNILHVARVPILFGAGFEETTEIKVGVDSAVTHADPQAKLEYVEHSGKAISAGRQDLVDLEERMSVMGAELLVSKPGTKTATESAADTAEANSALAAMTRDMQDVLAQALYFAAKWDKAGESGGTVKLHDGFATLEEFSVTDLLRARQIGVISSETVFAELQRRGLLDEALKWDDERARLTKEGPPAGIAGSFLAPPGGPAT